MAKIVKMEAGTYAWMAAGIEHELDEWESYDFMEDKWVPAKKYSMFWANPYPYPNGASFEEVLREMAEKLPQEAIIFYYDNESFGALRRKHGCIDLH